MSPTAAWCSPPFRNSSPMKKAASIRCCPTGATSSSSPTKRTTANTIPMIHQLISTSSLWKILFRIYPVAGSIGGGGLKHGGQKNQLRMAQRQFGQHHPDARTVRRQLFAQRLQIFHFVPVQLLEIQHQFAL